MNRNLLYIPLILLVVQVQANSQPPYAGQESRTIKALSKADIDGYLNGKGMGFAKAAELNHYPGPLHVLENKKHLKLNRDQLKHTQALYQSMKKQAVRWGTLLVKKERELDHLFTSKKVDKRNLEKKLSEIGTIRARIRNVHLSAHLKQRALLTQHQIMQYDKLRGYSGGQGGHQHNHNH